MDYRIGLKLVLLQREFPSDGCDVDGVNALVVDYPVILPMLSIEKHIGWFTKLLDIKSAFMNGVIDCKTFESHLYNVLKSSNYYKLKRP